MPPTERHMITLLDVDNPGVIPWAVKSAEKGIERGVIVRLWNVADVSASAKINFAPGIVSARRATHIETDLDGDIRATGETLTADFARQQIQTCRLVPAHNPRHIYP